MAAAVQAPERLVILEPVSWQTYERLLEEQQGRGGTRFTYDRGILEIMVLSIQHERLAGILTTLVDLLVLEFRLDSESLGSTTFRRPDLQQGFEPDSCFYIQHAEAVRGRAEIDLLVDPPPDLTIEIDITHQSLDRLPLFAAVGIPEVWRYHAGRVEILVLENSAYGPAEQSLSFPALSPALLNQFVQEGERLNKSAWMRGVREWARSVQSMD